MTAPLSARTQWLSAAEIAAEYGRHIRTVQRWCRDGTLVEFGFLVYRSSDDSWWIAPPPTV